MFYICVILLLGIIFLSKLYLKKKLENVNAKYFWENNKEEIDARVERYKNNSYYSVFREELKSDNLNTTLEKKLAEQTTKIIDQLIWDCNAAVHEYVKKYDDLKRDFDSIARQLDRAKIEFLNQERIIKQLKDELNKLKTINN